MNSDLIREPNLGRNSAAINSRVPAPLAKIDRDRGRESFRTASRLVGGIVMLLLLATSAHAYYPAVPFEEVVHSADLIFVGTVESSSSRWNDSGTMIFTDVSFQDVEVIHDSSGSVAADTKSFVLTHAGGEIGDLRANVSVAPSLELGHRYVLFSSYDGEVYANPIVGGSQGLFEVIGDRGRGQQYVLYGRRAVVDLQPDRVVTTRRAVTGLADGKLGFETPRSDAELGIAPVGAPAEGGGGASSRPVAAAQSQAPINLSEFLESVRVLLEQPMSTAPMLEWEGQGEFYRMEDGVATTESLPPLVERGEHRTPDPSNSGSVLSSEERGGALGACGYQDLYITMQQVPDTWWEFTTNNNSMWIWNQFMDLYRYSDSDGSFGSSNGQNEFCGYPSNAVLLSVYGFQWGGALAITVNWQRGECGEITEADICWNPAYSWTNDLNLALGNAGVILQQPVTMHELGHSWGEQVGTLSETYDYDVLTVMHRYYSGIVEDGFGIHRADAYLVRRIYDDQTTIAGTRDVGVESYYADNGLHNSTTDRAVYEQGDSITLRNIVVENNGFFNASDVRIRFFFSTNRTISTQDHQVGSYFAWSSFCGECTSVGNYTTTIPDDIPPGTYTVGAIVTIEGFSGDDFVYNNATFLVGSVELRLKDSDDDGTPDDFDNCPTVPNPAQIDGDADGHGDACDNCQTTSNADQADYDFDGMGDACEGGACLVDADRSGYVDGFDLGSLARAFVSTAGEPRYDETVDFTRNGMIDGEDLSFVAAEFGKQSACP